MPAKLSTDRITRRCCVTAIISILTLAQFLTAAPANTTGFNSFEIGVEIGVEIGTGQLAGVKSPYVKGIAAFYGIPYAAPPVGSLRWQAPQPVAAWSGARAASEPGAPCSQPLVPETSIYSRGPISPSEDCLYLNVWTARKHEAPRAVMVWFHGGGNTTGHGSSLIFDGSRLAEKGVVVVTANYRMGPFGFLAHPALSAESPHGSSGNYALLDQIAVLKWVQTNITRFGGDPSRVVIFGQSAGSLDVCLLMASPLARGLMSGVIGHSGGCMRVQTTLAEAEAAGEKVAAQFDATDLSSLRAIAASDFAAGAARAAVPRSEPIVDGWVVPDEPRRIFLAGKQNPVPLIVGDLADEFRGLGEAMTEMNQQQYEAAVRKNFPDIAEDLLLSYATVAAISPLEAYRKISTHSTFTWQSRTWADLVARSGGAAYLYQFTHPIAVFSLYIPERPEFPDPDGPRGLGAYHSGDLAYHFNNVGIVGLGWEDWDYRLADLISSYWVNFANTGSPNGASLPTWHRYAREADRVQEFGTAKIWSVHHPQHDLLNVIEKAYPERVSEPTDP